MLSKFQFAGIDLGNTAPRLTDLQLSGKNKGTANEEIVIDANITYATTLPNTIFVQRDAFKYSNIATKQKQAQSFTGARGIV